ncbi:MAG TPA: hypothetical protein PLN01_09965, partial [Spirochaetota bacterium]|nr:hypothetical protein [Spirochaetota bacterium]
IKQKNHLSLLYVHESGNNQNIQYILTHTGQCNQIYNDINISTKSLFTIMNKIESYYRHHFPLIKI